MSLLLEIAYGFTIDIRIYFNSIRVKSFVFDRSILFAIDQVSCLTKCFP